MPWTYTRLVLGAWTKSHARSSAKPSVVGGGGSEAEPCAIGVSAHSPSGAGNAFGAVVPVAEAEPADGDGDEVAEKRSPVTSGSSVVIEADVCVAAVVGCGVGA